jgi:hypothetical protein
MGSPQLVSANLRRAGTNKNQPTDRVGWWKQIDPLPLTCSEHVIEVLRNKLDEQAFHKTSAVNR